MWRIAEQLWWLVGAALGLSPALPARLATLPGGDELAAAVAVLAGGSILAGQVVVLAVNRVRPLRVLFSLALAGALFALGLCAWASGAWLCGELLLGARAPLGLALRVVGAGCAPLLLSFLVALPYLGPPVEWTLRTWCALIMLWLAQRALGFSPWQAIACASLGWLLLQAATRLLDRPLAALRDALWLAASGTHFDADEAELLGAAARELRSRLPGA